MSYRRRAAVRDLGLIALTVVLLAASVWYFVNHGTGEEPAPTDASSWTYFLCTDCREYFALNGAELEARLRKRDLRTHPGGAMAFACRKCGKFAAVRAGKCPEHGDIVKLQPGAGEPDKCSKCGFRP
jgi:predicted RNA-binding Zn-ribbon protein involved in translation (DUF1610 family)